MANQFLIKSTMADMRELSADEIMALQQGTYQGVKLLGYYRNGDTPAPIYYNYVSNSDAIDDGGSVIQVEGIKLLVDSIQSLTVFHFGAVADGESDSTIPLQNFIKKVNYLILPQGQFVISDTLLIPLGTERNGYRWYGESIEGSVLICRNMENKSAIALERKQWTKITIENLKIQGEVLNGINLDIDMSNGAKYVYQSVFRNLWLDTIGDSFKANSTFCCTWDNVHTNASNGHGLNIVSINTGLFTRCYAHRHPATKYGFYIYGDSTFLSCNGVDSGTGGWGYFYRSGDLKGNFTFIDCNFEAFTSVGITFTGGAYISLINCQFYMQGAFSENYNHEVSLSSGEYIIDIRNSFIAEPAMPRVSLAPIRLSSGALIKSFESNVPDFSAVVNNINTIVTQLPYSRYDAQTSSQRFSNLSFDRAYGFNLMRPLEISSIVGNTIDVSNQDVIRITDTAQVTIDGMTGGMAGQIITIIPSTGSQIILVNNSGNVVSGKIFLSQNANYTLLSGRAYVFVYTGASWHELSQRIINNASPTTKGLVNQSAASADTASAPSEIYTRSEVQDMLTELRDLKVKLRDAGILAV